MNKTQKDFKAVTNMKIDKLNEKRNLVAVTRKDEQLKFKEKCQKVQEKHQYIETKLKNREDKIDIFTKKHKQLNELRF